ncbi:MAG: hypothetical protein AAGA62_02125, partial [Bacteroidota bacterium]
MDTQEQIRNRILRAAARQWGHQESEMDLEAFDPLVRLLVDACSGETARLERLMVDSETRILERMLEQLSPEVLTGPRPAHGIAYLRALSGTELVTTELQCYATREEQKEKKEIYFSPLGNYPVVNGTIACLELGGELLYRVDENFQRELMARSGQRVPRRSSNLWIGLELDRKVTSLNGLRFYFNWLNAPHLEDNLEWLRHARWSCGGRPLTVAGGLRPQHRGEREEVVSFLNREYSRYHRSRTRILDRYAPHFVNLRGFADDAQPDDLTAFFQEYPKELEEVYALEDLTGLDRKLLWLRVDFPTQLVREDLLATTCAVNALPVGNLRRHRTEGRLRDQVNIIPLETENYYFDLLDARNRSGNAYDEVPLTNIREYRAGQYSVRRQDTGKFGEREAGRALLNLLDVLRDESAAFSAYGQDALRTKITGLNQQLKDLEQLVSERGGGSSGLAFMIVRPLERDRYLDVVFLSTQGSAGNGLLAGQELDLVRFTGIDRKTLRLLTTSTGGREPLSRQDRKYAYKKAIISRGRVVSREDIRAFCEAAFGADLTGGVL